LAGVEDEEVRQFSKGSFAIKLHVRALRKRRGAQGHHFVVGLIGVGTAEEELRGGDVALLGNIVGVVVVHFVIVPSEEPGAGGVHGLEVFVGAVLAVADAVVIERFDFLSDVSADVAPFSGGVFVDVITEVENEVGLVLFHLLVSGKKPLFPVLARGDREAEFFGIGVRFRQGAGATDGAGGVAGFEAVVIPGVRFEILCLDVNRESENFPVPVTFLKPSSSAISQVTPTETCGMPPPASSGLGARRVQRIMLS
jgi:hypothetical protein